MHIENVSAFTFKLYYTHIRIIEIYATMNLKFIDPNIILFHMMSHFGLIVKLIIVNKHWQPSKN